MNTKQFIELLKEEDPNGTATVVIGAYPVTGCDVNPGYWDGHYWKALNKDGKDCFEEYPSKMVLTGNGSKMKIRWMEPDTLLWDKMNAKGLKIEDYIEFDSAYAMDAHRQEQKQKWMKQFEETYAAAYECSVEMDKQWLPDTIKLFEEGEVYSEKNEGDKWWRTYIDRKGIFGKKDALMQGYIMILRDYPETFEYEENADGTRRVWKLKHNS